MASEEVSSYRLGPARATQLFLLGPAGHVLPEQRQVQESEQTHSSPDAGLYLSAIISTLSTGQSKLQEPKVKGGEVHQPLLGEAQIHIMNHVLERGVKTQGKYTVFHANTQDEN